MCLKTHSFLLVFFISTRAFFCQEPVSINFTIEDGLPSNELHSLSFGPNGKLWIASDNGISVYDGYEFNKFSKRDGLADIVDFEIYRDDKNRMWAISHSGNLSVFENGRFKPYKFNQNILKFKGNSSFPHLDFRVDSLDNVFISFHNSGLLKIDSSGTSTSMARTLNSHDVRIQFIDNLGGDVFIFSDTRTHNLPYDNLSLIKTRLISDDTTDFIRRNNGYGISYDFFNYDMLGDSLVFSVGNTFNIKFHDIHIQHITQHPVKCFIILKDKVWIGLLNGGIDVLSLKDLNLVENHYFEKITPTDLIKDSEGGIWVSTVQKGLFYIPNINSKQLVPKGTSVLTLESDDKYLYASEINGDLLRFQEDYLIDNISTDIFKNIPAKQILVDDNYILLLKNNRVVKISGESESILICTNDFECSIKEIYREPNGDVYLLGTSILKLNEDFSFSYVDGLDSSLVYFNAITALEGNSLLLGSDIGLFIFKNDTLHSFSFEKRILKSKINSLLYIGSGKVLIGTRSDGLLLFNFEKNIVDNICLSNDICDYTITSIKLLNDNSVWFSSNIGLGNILFVDSNKEEYTVHHYTQINGIMSNQITDIEFYRDYLYIASKQGLVKVSISDLKKKNPPKIILEQLMVSGDTIFDFLKMEFQYDQNEFFIRYKGIDLKSSGDILYEYYLDGYSDLKYYTTNLSINYGALAPGNYVFQVYAINKYGIRSPDPVSFSFIINSPFWIKGWFVFISALVIISIIFLILSFYFKTKLKNRENVLMTKNKIIELEMSVFRAQMNPHFIFNTLNSIRYFISSGMMAESEKYLVRFSKLLRTVTHETPKSFITLENELINLEDYIVLEKMRFNRGFESNISLETNIESKKIRIPSFILQPFVENSIEHGQIHKIDNGRINLNFSLENDILVVQIIDNGIGRENASRRRKKYMPSHKPIAISNIKKRLELLNSNSEKKIVELSINDLYNSSRVSIGTEIILKIIVQLISSSKSKFI